MTELHDETRADLHVHSHHSDRPTEWLLRRIGAPECYTPPRVVYDVARRRHMDFVTISDHNCIRGAVEIAHLPGVFVSNEITTYFPEDGCKVHVLCWDISEPHFNEIQRLRENIVELRDYLWQEGIPHGCAHPLYSINDRLTIEHFEQLLLLFNVFETMNGGRNRRGNDVVQTVISNLTREQFEEIASRHRIKPVGDEPWVKGATGGSDDHSGVFVAKGFTVTPASTTPRAFLQQVMSRRSLAGGLDGTPLSFAHSLYSIGYQYYRDRFLSKSGGRELMIRTIGEWFGPEQTRFKLRDRVSYYARRFVRRSERPDELEFKRLVSQEMTTLFGGDWLHDDFALDAGRYEQINRQTFELASRVSNQLLFQFARRFVDKLSAGSVFGSVEALSAAGPVILGIAPYLFSFAHQSRDRQFLEHVRRRFADDTAPAVAVPRKAWFVDSLGDVNGVTTLVQQMGVLAGRHRHDLELITCDDQADRVPMRMKTFKPVGQFTLPEAGMTLAFPPFLEILDYCDREQFTELIVSTPSLTGLAAMAAGRILNIPVVGIYHTDLPKYIRYYTDDESLESAAWYYLRWFYDQMSIVYVPSQAYRQQLLERGFDGSRLRLFPHGIDVNRFHPHHRRREFWRQFSDRPGPTVVYVGRAAPEKDLDVLAEAYAQLAAVRPDCTLAVVGDGPMLAALRARLPQDNVVFTGFLFDDDLSAAYAGADVFVFPSTTDTFGNVVLEAMASGLPVVVADKGGPAEIVRHEVTGLVTRGRAVGDLVAAVERLLDDTGMRREMGVAARAHAEACSWERIYLDFWHGSTRAEAS